MKWWLWLAAIIAVGILSRVLHTGSILWDKYLGDSLYAAMVYAILSLTVRFRWWKRAILAMGIMTALEVFQLTMIPAKMLLNPNLGMKILARLLGTEFSLRDLAAYAISITGIALITKE